MAERVGFEPTCRLPDKTLSRRPRYDHFGTSPLRSVFVKRTFYYTVLGRCTADDGFRRAATAPPAMPPTTFNP